MVAIKVLVLDDEPLTCKLIETMLRLNGFASVSLTDASKVVDVAQAEEPDVILMDFHLGSSHGLDVLQTLKTHPVSQSIPVILASGMDYRQESLEAGAFDFLIKPFDWHDLSDVINRSLGISTND